MEQYLHIATRHNISSSKNPLQEQHDFVVKIHYSSTLKVLEQLSNAAELQYNEKLSGIITSWLRLFGIFVILNEVDQGSDLTCLELGNGNTLSIMSCNIIDADALENLKQNVAAKVYEYSDQIDMWLVSETVSSPMIAHGQFYAKNYNVAVEPKLEANKTYKGYCGCYGLGESVVQLIASDLDVLPSFESFEKLGRKFIRFNILELFKHTDDIETLDTDIIRYWVNHGYNVGNHTGDLIVMDYIELQSANIDNQVFAFFGNDPAQ